MCYEEEDRDEGVQEDNDLDDIDDSGMHPAQAIPSERLHLETYPGGCDDENCTTCDEARRDRLRTAISSEPQQFRHYYFFMCCLLSFFVFLFAYVVPTLSELADKKVPTSANDYSCVVGAPLRFAWNSSSTVSGGEECPATTIDALLGVADAAAFYEDREGNRRPATKAYNRTNDCCQMMVWSEYDLSEDLDEVELSDMAQRLSKVSGFGRCPEASKEWLKCWRVLRERDGKYRYLCACWTANEVELYDSFYPTGFLIMMGCIMMGGLGICFLAYLKKSGVY